MAIIPATALNRARAKAYIRLLPLLCISYAIAYVDRVNVSLATIEMSKDLGCDLRLMSSQNDVSGIPTVGKNLIIVAPVEKVLHFRIFDLDGKLVVDTDEKSLTDKVRQIEDLRRQLESLWPPHELAGNDKDRLITAVTSIVGHSQDLLAFNNAVVGFGAGVFFIGYFILEIPGTLLVEKWSARKWICRIMVSWGIIAALTAFVKTPLQFYVVRFFLGLAEAGFFPGVIVYLTHWFPARDRAKALSWFFIATPVAQFISPRLSYYLLRIGTTETIGDVMVHHPALWGLQGWQWMYIAWGLPAVVLGILVLFGLPDWPRDARWLEPDERDALEQELKGEKERHQQGRRHKNLVEALVEAFQHPKVLLLAAAYFFVVTSSYGVEIFLPKILERWYDLQLNAVTWAVIIPPLGGLAGQLLVGWSSDRTGERRLHGSVPIYVGAMALGCTLLIPASLSFNTRLVAAVSLFTVALMGLKSYMPAFWALPSLLLTEAAAAGSVGLINSVGNLGGFVGPFLLGSLENLTHSFLPGLLYLCFSMIVSATIILTLGLGHRATGSQPIAEAPSEDLADAVIDPI